MTKTPTIPSLPLRGGTKIPQIGLGVWKAARGSASHDALTAGLRLGYPPGLAVCSHVGARRASSR